MGIISCPSCQGKLRVPDDGAARKVKCPSCQKIFTTGATTDRKGPPSGGPKSGGPQSKPTPKPAFEIIDDDDDGEEERPSKSRRGGDLSSVLDQGNRGKSRRDDDDDDEDRPRSRRRRDDDDDDNDDDRRGSRRGKGKRSGAGSGRANWPLARTGLFLNFLAQWCMVGALGLVFLVLLLLWAGVFPPNFLGYFVGLAGLASWILAAVGTCFFFALGPTRGPAFGLGIAVGCITLIHVVLLLMQLTGGGGLGGLFPIGGRGFGGGGSSLNWGAMVSQLYGIPTMISSLVQTGGRGLFNSTASLTPILEVARLVLLMLFIRATAEEMRDSSSARLAMTVGIGVPSALVVLGLVNLVLNEILSGVRDPNVAMIVLLFTNALFIGLIVFIALGVKAGMDAIDRRL